MGCSDNGCHFTEISTYPHNHNTARRDPSAIFKSFPSTNRNYANKQDGAVISVMILLNTFNNNPKLNLNN